MGTELNPDPYTAIRVGLDDHLERVHITHFVGIDGRDIWVRVFFNADDECTVTVDTAPGMKAVVATMKWEGK